MRLFFKNLTVILLSALGLMLLLDLLYTFGYKYGEPRNKIQYLFQSEPQHYDFVFFGSSRTESTIDCEVIERITGKSCINFGIAGSSLGDALLVMELLDSQGITYDNAVLQLADNYNSTGNSDFVLSTIMPFKSHPLIDKKIEELPEGVLYTNLPFYRYMAFDKVIGARELTASLLGRQSTIDYQNGFWGLEHRSELTSTKFPKIIIEQNPEIAEIQTLLEEQGTRLILFTAPYCHKAETKEFMEGLIAQFPNLYNYIGLFENQQEYFADCGHLNTEGARAFTENFILDLIFESK